MLILQVLESENKEELMVVEGEEEEEEEGGEGKEEEGEGESEEEEEVNSVDNMMSGSCLNNHSM